MGLEVFPRSVASCLVCSSRPPFTSLSSVLIMTVWASISDCPTWPCAVVCSKQYVLLSVLLCLLASGLVFFFLFPHSVLVDDNGVRVAKVTFSEQDSLVILEVTVRRRASLPGSCTCHPWTRTPNTHIRPCPFQATLKIRNTNFYSVTVTNLFSQVQYMKAVVGTYMTANVSFIPPRSEHLVCCPCRASAYMGRRRLGAVRELVRLFLPHGQNSVVSNACVPGQN